MVMTSKLVCRNSILRGTILLTTAIVPKSFAMRVCNGFAQLGSKTLYTRMSVDSDNCSGARGVSLMFSSGDGGVGDGDF